ncbi:ADP-ribosylglycohydrolase family protein [Salininema proteolyticum]|uniref:ADP-ribosylglycohydrolase family protein n=1 Tax=Salininema proteolyticum TaxID=1607685 RepID=A0ABV8U135_9ACTN
MSHIPSPTERINGCLLGGAIGDALGYRVEFHSWSAIEREFGSGGVRDMHSNLVSDDTQMTLFTAQGLLEARPGKEFGAVRKSYLDWLDTQRLPMPHVHAHGLASEEWLYNRRAPGQACITGLRNGGRPGVNPDSKGCGTVMRSAPFGLMGLSPEAAYDLSARCATITHGHPTAAEAAGAFAMITAHIMNGADLNRAVDDTLLYLQRDPSSSETADALNAAYELAGRIPPEPGSARHLGEGWTAEEALGIGVYCALGAPDPASALTAAVSHGGDSDSTGSVCGNLVGAAFGEGALPDQWKQVEGQATILKIGGRLAKEFH